MIDLKIDVPTKILEINGKLIKIPKLGLKQRLLVDVNKGYEENLNSIIQSIHKSLSRVERDLVILHLMNFNDKLHSEIEIDGFTYKLDNVYPCQKLSQKYDDYEFKFRTPNSKDLDGPLDLILANCCVWVKYKGEKIDLPKTFLDLPAFAYHWIDELCTTIALDGPDGQIRGINKIIEVLGV